MCLAGPQGHVVGDGEAGKTSVRNALAGFHNPDRSLDPP